MDDTSNAREPRLVGIEPNPGPSAKASKAPKSAPPTSATTATTRTIDETTQHLAVRLNLETFCRESSAQAAIWVTWRDEMTAPRISHRHLAVLRTKVRSQRGTWKVELLHPDSRAVALLSTLPCPVDCDTITYLSCDPYVPEAEPPTHTPPARCEWSDVTDDARPDYDMECIPTIQRVPRPALPAFHGLLRATIGGYASSDTSVDKRRRWDAFLSIPKRHLRRVLGTCPRRARARHLASQLSGRVLTQSADTVKHAVSTPVDDDARAIRSAKSMAASGYLGRAAKRLDRAPEGKRMSTDALLDAVRKLHPAGEPPKKLTTTERETLSFDQEEFITTLRGLCSGSSPGVTGWTEELLSDAAEDTIVAAALVAMCVDIANDDLPEHTRHRLRRSRLLAIPKPDSGIRPIAIGDALFKLTTRLLLLRHATSIASHFEPLQFGIACKAGAEKIVHRIRAALLSGGDDFTIATLDASNAFNTPTRSAIAAAIDATPCLYPFRALFNCEYGSSGELLLFTDSNLHVIASERGTRQGSAGGALFFAATIHPVLVDAARLLPNVTLHAYLDDITLAGPPSDVAKCRLHIEHQLANMGIGLNSKKCEWFSSIAAPPGFSNSEEGIKVLGAWIARSSAPEARFLTSKLQKHQCMFRRLLLAPPQLSVPLLTVCTVPRMSYYTRTHAPESTAEATTEFDGNVERVWLAAAQIRPTDEVRTVAHLPLHSGGLGASRSNWIREGSYRASLAEALSTPLDLDQRPISQAASTELLSTELTRQLVASDRAWEKHLAEHARPGASVWLRSPSTTVGFDSSSFASALRLRLRSPHASLPEFLHCDGCHVLLPAQLWLTHVASCARREGYNASSRHALFKKALGACLDDVGISRELSEPREYTRLRCPGCWTTTNAPDMPLHLASCPKLSPSQRRTAAPQRSGPDMRIHMCGEVVTIDVTVVDPLAPSYAATTTAALVKQRVKEKYALYGEATKANGERFVVAVASAQGALFEDAKQLVGEIARAGNTSYECVARHIRDAVVLATARSLAAAERRANVPPWSSSTSGDSDSAVVPVPSEVASPLTPTADCNNYTDADDCPNDPLHRATAAEAPTATTHEGDASDNDDTAPAPDIHAPPTSVQLSAEVAAAEEADEDATSDAFLPKRRSRVIRAVSFLFSLLVSRDEKTRCIRSPSPTPPASATPFVE